jgi:hypothetical protein
MKKKEEKGESGRGEKGRIATKIQRAQNWRRQTAVRSLMIALVMT